MANDRGFYLLVDILLSIIFVFALVLLVQPQAKEGYQELLLSQKAHDLLIVWQKSNELSLKEMQSDFEFFLNGKSGEIELDGETIKIGKQFFLEKRILI